MSKRNHATVTCSLAQNDLVDFVEEYELPLSPPLSLLARLRVGRLMGLFLRLSSLLALLLEFIFVKETLISYLHPDLITDICHGQGSLAYPYPKEPFDEALWNRLRCHTFEAQTFIEPILYLVGLSSSWDHAPSNPSIFVDGEEIAFRNFIKKPGQNPSFFVRSTYQPVDVGS
ncbi:hypothetical protein Tco_0363572 [Tanacetum coccineum]